MQDMSMRITTYPVASAVWIERLGLLEGVDLVECAGAADVLELIARSSVDAVLVDLDSGDPEVIELMTQVGICGAVPVLACADAPTVLERAAALESGAAVVVTSAISDVELVAQLRSVCRLTVPPARSPLRFHAGTMEIERGGERVALTRTQWKLLMVLNSRPGRHFSATELMSRVWGHTTGPTSTVSVHLHRLRLKLESDPSQPSLIQTERGRGYALLPSLPAEEPLADDVDREVSRA